MSKPTGPGSEIDSYCTKCKMDLNHRVIAMEGARVKRVECLTCRGHHNYRRPKSAEPESRPARSRSPGSTSAPPSRARRVDAKKTWEQAIMGKTPTDFTAYTVTQLLAVGQLVHHKKFGDGVVAELIEGGKVQVLFEAGAKTLVHGR